MSTKTMASARAPTVIRHFRDVLALDQDVAILWVVGSYTKGDGLADGIDMLALFRHGGIEIHAPIVRELMQAAEPDATVSESDDSLICQVAGWPQVGIALHDKQALINRVECHASGCNLDGTHKPWAAGYWLPEALCADLAASQLLFDRIGADNYISSLLNPYPALLSDSICDLCRSEIRQKLGKLLSPTAAGQSAIEQSMVAADIAAALVRFAFARERCYLRGFSHITQQATLLSGAGRSIVRLAERLAKHQLSPTSAETESIKEEIRHEIHGSR